jgi:predicted DNA-binding transcriptional regulator YafY
MSKTARLFQLMQVLRQSPPPARAGNLAHEMGVSSRTIYRDIEALRGLGAVIDGEAGFGYTLIEDATLPPLGFDEEEIEALVLGLRSPMLQSARWPNSRPACRRANPTGSNTQC